MFRSWRGKLLAGVVAFAAVTGFAPTNHAQAQCYYGYGFGPAYGPGSGYGFSYYSGVGYSAVLPRNYYYGYYGGFGPS